MNDFFEAVRRRIEVLQTGLDKVVLGSKRPDLGTHEFGGKVPPRPFVKEEDPCRTQTE